MKQLQHQFIDINGFKKFILDVEETREELEDLGGSQGAVLFHVYAEILDAVRLDKITAFIGERIPGAIVVGTTTNGNIGNGLLSDYAITVTATLFEKASTRVEMMSAHLSEESMEKVTDEVVRYVEQNHWVKAVEVLTTIRGMSMTSFCEQLQNLREGVHLFGGGAFAEDINNQEALVFSSERACSDHSAVFVFYGGEELHLVSGYLTGWLPLGKTFTITEAQGPILHKLDGVPAYDVYYKYLNIDNDENFFRNTLEFPFIYLHNGQALLRAPVSCLEDGSLVMTSDIQQNVKARIAYGDPQRILKDVQEMAKSLQGFQPDIINLYSCAARKYYWNGKTNQETGPFARIASTSGFYTSSEFLRTGNNVNQHNVTLVIAAMREGGEAAAEPNEFRMKKVRLDGEVSMVNRLAHLVMVATRELEAANRELELRSMRDGLTGLINREQTQKRMQILLDLQNRFPCSCIMLDLDDFKRINDTFGHLEGDRVLIQLSRLMERLTAEHVQNHGNEAAIKEALGWDAIHEGFSETFCGTASVGRWGGEEFMILLPTEDVEQAVFLAEELRKTFADMEFDVSGHHTLSLGVTQARPGDTLDRLASRVDDALYEAKGTGKNKVVIL